jgi:hypothetical protein
LGGRLRLSLVAEEAGLKRISHDRETGYLHPARQHWEKFHGT